MKKLSIIIFSILFIAAFMPRISTPAYAESAPIAGADGYLKPFLAIKDRTSGSEGEKNAALFIRQSLIDAGFSETNVLIDNFKTTVNTETLTSQNVIATITPSVQYTHSVVIGAHYDNQFSSISQVQSGTGAEGAYDNGCAVSALLTLAKNLKSDPEYLSVPFKTVFVFFGAQSLSFAGSRHYFEGLNDLDRSRTLLYMNYDIIGGGDYLYMYCDEVKTNQEKYFMDIAKASGQNIRLAPANKKTMSMTQGIGSYTHYGLQSDNVVAMAHGIPSVNFLSLNWDTGKYLGMVESETKPPILGTKNDTYAKLTEYYSDYSEKLDAVCNITASGLKRAGFIDAAQQFKIKAGYSFLTDARLHNIIMLAFCVIVIASVILIARRIQKNNPPPEEKPAYVKVPVFGKAYENAESEGAGQGDIFNGY